MAWRDWSNRIDRIDRTCVNPKNWDWLEEMLSPRALQWAYKESNLTRDTIDAFPQFEPTRNRLLELAGADLHTGEFYLDGGQLLRLQRNATHEYGVLERAERAPDGSVSQWHLVTDIGALGKAEGRAYQFIWHNFGSQLLGQNGSRLLLGLSDGGQDYLNYREVVVETGELVTDGFNTEPGVSLDTVAWLDLDHILIAYTRDGEPTTTAGYPTTAYLWERGTPLEAATPIYSGSATEAAFIVANFGAGDTHRGLIRRHLDYFSLVHSLVSLDGTVEEVMMPRGVANTRVDVQTARHLIQSLTEPATVNGTEYPAGTVLAYDMVATSEPGDSRITIVYVPEENEFNPDVYLDGLDASYSRVYLTTTLEGNERRLVLEYDSPSWKLIRTTPTGDGLHAAVAAAGRHTNDVVFSESGYLQPAKFWLETTGDDGEPSQYTLHQQNAAFDSDGFTSTKGVATSKDGTQIDYLVVAPVDRPAGKLPVLMTGYGGFGSSITTGYLTLWVGGAAVVPWFEAGGALVVAYIRGGGEKGPEWHTAAMRENRQLSYDDFIAVAEKLIADGLTAPAHLGVFGSSHGGLLAAVMGTQRPDLFSAVVPDAPFTDMLRFKYMAAAGMDEYGDPDDPVMRAIILKYSPYHNIEKGVDYPAFLSTVATNDYRVGPGHARKFIAKLKEFGVPDSFLFEAESGGHGASSAFQNADQMARRMAFFMHYLS
jgi:prolyl oligopeptidase